MQPSFVAEAMITTGVKLKRLMECLAACFASKVNHGNSITSASVEFMALQLTSITLCVHKLTLDVTARMPLKCESGADVHKTYILSMLTTSADRLSQVIEGPIFNIFLYTVRV
jgi:hypothetical protein